MDVLQTATLIPKHGASYDLAQLKDKTVLLYFTGEWCPPCRVFTPELVKFYMEYVDTKKFEIILISSDRTEAEYKHTIEDLPWVALAYKDQPSKMKLAQRYKIKGIPALVVLDGATGNTINDNARPMLIADPKGTQFPWMR
jgi:nucleoredoxin